MASTSSTEKFNANVVLTNESGGINSQIKGISFQLKILLLTIIKSFQISSNFNAAVEIKQAKSFDDVLLDVNGKTRFIQCKSKEQAINLKFEDFVNNKKKEFSLSKYFEGFVDIENDFGAVGSIMICTNCSILNIQSSTTIVLSDGKGGELKLQRASKVDDIFTNFKEQFEIDGSCYKTRTTLQRNLANKFSSQLIKDNLDNFCQKVLLIFDMEEKNIDCVIEEFFQKEFNLYNVNYLKMMVMQIMYEWVKNIIIGPAQTIDRKLFIKILEDIKRHINIQKVIDRSSGIFHQKEIRFKEQNKIEKFIEKITRDQNQLYHMQTSDDETFYGCCKVYQALKDKKYPDTVVFLTTELSEQYLEDGLDVFSQEDFIDFLIFSEESNNLISTTHKIKLRDVLKDDSNKRVLIITDQKLEKFEAEVEKEETLFILEKIEKSDITDDSQNFIPKSNIVSRTVQKIVGDSVEFDDGCKKFFKFLMALSDEKDIVSKIRDGKIAKIKSDEISSWVKDIKNFVSSKESFIQEMEKQISEQFSEEKICELLDSKLKYFEEKLGYQQKVLPDENQKGSSFIAKIVKPTWVACQAGSIPDGAIVGGVDDKNLPLYVGRAHHEGGLLPGKVAPHHHVCYLSCDGHEFKKLDYEVLIGSGAKWVQVVNCNVPSNAFKAGTSAFGDIQFVGRVQHKGTISVGKVDRSYNALIIPFEGHEVSFSNFEILTFD